MTGRRVLPCDPKLERPRDRRLIRSGSAALLGLILCGLSGCEQPFEAIVVRVTHRVFTTFNETHRVAPGERFPIGDTEFSGRIVEFLPDFALEETTKKPFSRSRELRNPAVRIEVYEGNRKIEDAWAFQGAGPPHYAKTSLLAFRLEELVWRAGQEPISPTPAADSTAASPADTVGSPGQP